MTCYVDTSALLKRYVQEPDSGTAAELLDADPELVTARHTIIEARRNIVRLAQGRAVRARVAALHADLESIALIELDAVTCDMAATVAEETGVRTLDALHLGAALRLGPGLTFLTFDRRQARAARALGLAVVGA